MELNEAQIRNIIKDELTQYAYRNMFNVSDIPVHAHTGTDSPQVDANTLAFSVPYFTLVNTTTTPTVVKTGAISSVNGTLMICTGTSVWAKVGSQ